MQYTLSEPVTDLIETYSMSVHVPAITSGFTEPAFEITSARVHLTMLAPSPENDREIVAGEVMASVHLSGYPLTPLGLRDPLASLTEVHTSLGEEGRWEIARQALARTRERFDLLPYMISGHPTETWAEHRAGLGQRLAQDVGLLSSPGSLGSPGMGAALVLGVPIVHESHEEP
jgi:hypothetical protein